LPPQLRRQRRALIELRQMPRALALHGIADQRRDLPQLIGR
jgi:hypothetical protein